MTKRRILALPLAAILAASAVPAIARTEGSLSGVVRDGDRKPLPGATVAVESASLLGSRRAVPTDADGSYRFPALPPGTYRVTVEMMGFQKADLPGVQVQINQPASLDVVLMAEGSAGLEVFMDVDAHEDIVQIDKAQTSTALNNEFVDNIPVLGRAYQTLLLLAPGVTNQDGQGFFGSGNVMSHGSRPDANQYLFDGGNTTDTTLGTFGGNFNQDNVDQIEVITAGYKAEYGRSDGAISNVLTKSGGNAFEGSLRVDLRDSSLDRHGSGKQDVQDQDFYRRYYSATLGGPIVKDRFWFYAGVYWQDRNDVETFDGDAAYPVQDAPADFYDYFGKLSYQINDDHQLVFSYHYDPAVIHNSNPGGNLEPSYRSEQYQHARFWLLKESAVFSPNVFLESLIYLNDDQEIVTGPDRDAPDTDAPFSGLDRVTGVYVGRWPYTTFDSRDRNQFREDLSVYVDDAMGTHDIKVGVGYELEFSFSDFRQEDVYILENGIPVEKDYSPTGSRFSPESSAHARIFSLYAQDSWSPRDGLTLHLGIRADYEELEWNGFSGADRWQVDPTFRPEDARVIVDEVSDLGVVPRLGFSWDPLADGRHVIRGSASRFYTTIPGYAGNWDRNGVGGTLHCNTDPQGNCLDTEAPELTLYYLDRDIRMPHTDELTLGYERELVPELALGVTAIYKRGRDLLQDRDLNTHYTGDTDGDGYPEKKTFVNPNFQTLYVLGNDNESTYRGVELSLRKRLSRNWQLLASYTYSVARGDGEWGGTAEGDDERDIPYEYSYLPWDQRHVVKVDGTYFLPWDVIVAASARFYTGTPYSTTSPNWVDLNGNGWPDIGETGSIAGGGDRYIGKRNGNRNDSYANLDLRAEKSFAFAGVSLGVFADVFNVLNDQSVIATTDRVLVHDPTDPDSTPGGRSKVETERFGRRFQLGFRVSF